MQEFRKFANIPGFRPGKAPEPMVEKRYGGEIDEELRKRLIPESYREALAEQKLKVVGYPQVESVEYERGRPLVYTAAVDTAPEFPLPEYKGIPLKKKPVVVKDEDIAKTLESLREQQADFVAVEGRALETGDFAVVNYSGVADGKPISELAPEAKGLGENKDFWLLISSESFLPGFCDQLVGANAGEKRQVLVDFPADFPAKTAGGQEGDFFRGRGFDQGKETARSERRVCEEAWRRKCRETERHDSQEPAGGGRRPAERGFAAANRGVSAGPGGV